MGLLEGVAMLILAYIISFNYLIKRTEILNHVFLNIKTGLIFNLLIYLFFFFFFVRVPSSIPGSNSLCSCHSLQRGGAVAMVTELALSFLWRHSW